MPHIHDNLDNTVEVFVVYDRRVLLRRHDKYGFWLSVGGHVEPEEDPNEAAIREVKEEVGLDIELYNDDLYPLTERDGFKELIPPRFMNRHTIRAPHNPNHQHVTLVYFARSKTDQLSPAETEEKSPDCKWFTGEELDDPQYALHDDVKKYAKSALETLVDSDK